MQITFTPAAIALPEWVEIQALIASLRGDEFAYGEGGAPATPEPTESATPASVVTAAPPPPTAEAAPTPAPAAAPLPSEALMQAAVAAKVGGVDIDKNGIPWDARIHSDPASKTAKGEWRKKRGVDDDLVASVTAELLQVMAAPPAPAPVAEAAPAAPVASVAPPPPEVAASPAVAVENGAVAQPYPAPAIIVEGNAPVASPEPAPAAPAPTVAPSAPAPTPPAANAESGAVAATVAVNPFADLMKDIVGKKAAGLITDEKINEAAQALGLTGLRDLSMRHDLIPAFADLLG